MTVTSRLGYKLGALTFGASTWNCSKAKRLFDLVLAAALLILASPIMLAVAVIVKLSSRGPIFYLQRRVGRDGREFQLIKFRTMVDGGRIGPRITRAGDPRITATGRLLRQWKLDELPQLLNVVRGEMSFVGPRPDLAEYLVSLDSEHRKILKLPPGLTGAASLHYRDEEKLLSRVPEGELQRFYCAQVLPDKVRIDLQYARNAGLMSDLSILFRTIRMIFHH